MAVTDTEVQEADVEDAPGPSRPAPVLPEPWPQGTDHKSIGSLFVVAALVFLVAGAVLALVMRAQLATPEADIVGDRTYRQLFTMHGTISVFLFLLPVWLGVGAAIVPLQVGAARVPFPRLHAMSFWLFLAGGVMVAVAPTQSDVFHGWTLSDPIPVRLGLRGQGPDLVLLGLALVCLAAILVIVNLIVTILQLRAPGLTLRRVPMFSWSIMVSGAVLLLALPVLIGAFGMLFLDRHYGTSLFSGFTGSRGGNPLMWPRLFWFGAYPMLWALLIPALGAVSEIVATFAGRPLFSRDRASAALVGVGVLSFAGWGSEVQTLARARPLWILGGLAVLAPVALLVLNWLATLRVAGKEGNRYELRRRFRSTPMLWALGMLPVLGLGLAASVVSAVDASRDAHANYWQTGQQHALFFGAATIGAVAALSYWGPKLWGRRLSDALGKLEVLGIVGGTLLTVLGMLLLGAQDMLIHTSTFDANDEWELGNLAVSGGAAIIGLGLLVLVLDLLATVVARRGRTAGADPWGGQTLEWATTSPPPLHNFDALPEIRSDTPLRDLRIAQAQSAAAGPPPTPEEAP
ncbi:MAG TPA: cbb3-type cytochrome c oxidase subunit I [Acidimicrobiales bacterium]|nr:cbb3-type cytochrome c oxidase subunit I [Acidimicrobiales bacterium]